MSVFKTVVIIICEWVCTAGCPWQLFLLSKCQFVWNWDLNFTISLCIKHLYLLSVGELALFAKLDDERDRGNELQVTLRITVKVTMPNSCSYLISHNWIFFYLSLSSPAQVFVANGMSTIRTRKPDHLSCRSHVEVKETWYFLCTVVRECYLPSLQRAKQE